MRRLLGSIVLWAALSLAGGCADLWHPFLGAAGEGGGDGGGVTDGGGTAADLPGVPDVSCRQSNVVRNGDGTLVSTVVTTTTLYGVWGAGDDSVWAVGGGGLVLHWDGAGWKTEHDGGSQLHSVWGFGDAYVVTAGRDSGILHRIAAGTWSPDTVTAANATLQEVRGSGTAFQLAVGLGGVVLQNNGAIWTAATLKPANTLSVNAILIQSPTRVVLAGQDTATGGGFVVQHDYAALSWTESWRKTSTDPVFGLVLSGTDIWAAGPSGSLTRYKASGVPTAMPSSVLLTTRRLRSALAAGAFWLVGDGGQIHYWDGASLIERESGTTLTLYDAWQAPGGVLWVVGQNGTILRCAPQ